MGFFDWFYRNWFWTGGYEDSSSQCLDLDQNGLCDLNEPMNTGSDWSIGTTHDEWSSSSASDSFADSYTSWDDTTSSSWND